MVMVLALTALVCQALVPPPRPLVPAPPAAEVDRIAYVGPDGNLFSIRPDGTQRRQLTSGEEGPSVSPLPLLRGQGRTFYTWPTWSPEGARLAVSPSLRWAPPPSP